MNEPLSQERQETLRAWFEEGIPFNRVLGLRVEALTRGKAILRVPWKTELTGDASRPAVHGGVLSMLIDKEACWGYTLGAGLTLGAMAVATAYYEVQAGLAYPTDAPLSILYGAINGAGTFMWHRWFWGGWPGEKTGDLPLRLRGVGLTGTRGGAAVSARLVF